MTRRQIALLGAALAGALASGASAAELTFEDHYALNEGVRIVDGVDARVRDDEIGGGGSLRRERGRTEQKRDCSSAHFLNEM